MQVCLQFLLWFRSAKREKIGWILQWKKNIKDNLTEFLFFFLQRGTSGIDIDLRRVDIDQCPGEGGSGDLNIFRGTDKCKKKTTFVSTHTAHCSNLAWEGYKKSILFVALWKCAKASIKDLFWHFLTFFIRISHCLYAPTLKWGLIPDWTKQK